MRKSEMSYERFHIETSPAPHQFSVPPKFNPRANWFRLAKLLLQEGFHYRFKKEVWLSRPCIYGVFSGRLGGFKPIKGKCVGCMRCVQEYPHIMKVDNSKEYLRLGDSSWTPEAVSTVLYEASSGKIPVRGMGYKGPFSGKGFDSIWTDMSEIVRPTRDGVYGREFISTIVDIGRKSPYLQFSDLRSQISDLKSRLVEIPIPILFDALPEKASNIEIQTAIALAAQRLDSFFISRINQLPPESSSGSNFQLLRHWIPLVSSSDLEGERIKESHLQKARIIEYEYDDGEGYKRIRSISPDAVLSVRLPLGEDTKEIAESLVLQGVDVLHLYADYQGKGGSRHIKDLLLGVHNHLVEVGIRDEVTIVASGGIILAEHVPKTIIRGADLVALDTAILVALESEFKGKAVSSDLIGLRPRKIDSEWGAQRITNLMASWHDQLIEILSAMGIRDVRRLRGEVGRSMTVEELEEEAFGEIERVSSSE